MASHVLLNLAQTSRRIERHGDSARQQNAAEGIKVISTCGQHERNRVDVHGVRMLLYMPGEYLVQGREIRRRGRGGWRRWRCAWCLVRRRMEDRGLLRTDTQCTQHITQRLSRLEHSIR